MNLNVSSTTHHIVEFMRCLLTEPSWIDCQFAFSWPVRFLQLILLRVFFSFKKIPRFTFACLLGQFVCGWPGASLRQHPKFQARSQSPRTPGRRGPRHIPVNFDSGGLRLLCSGGGAGVQVGVEWHPVSKGSRATDESCHVGPQLLSVFLLKAPIVIREMVYKVFFF